MSVSLSRVIPAHRRTIEFLWIKRDFMLFGVFKAARARMQLNPIFERCFWCKTPFKETDMMALAGQAKGANRVLCQDCVALLPSPPPSSERPVT